MRQRVQDAGLEFSIPCQRFRELFADVVGSEKVDAAGQAQPLRETSFMDDGAFPLLLPASSILQGLAVMAGIADQTF
eukprot:255574-Karenia_brevis.AAC.1